MTGSEILTCMCTKWIDREYDYTFFGMKPFDDVLPTKGDQLFDLGSGIYVVCSSHKKSGMPDIKLRDCANMFLSIANQDSPGGTGIHFVLFVTVKNPRTGEWENFCLDSFGNRHASSFFSQYEQHLHEDIRSVSWSIEDPFVKFFGFSKGYVAQHNT